MSCANVVSAVDASAAATMPSISLRFMTVSSGGWSAVRPTPPYAGAGSAPLFLRLRLRFGCAPVGAQLALVPLDLPLFSAQAVLVRLDGVFVAGLAIGLDLVLVLLDLLLVGLRGVLRGGLRERGPAERQESGKDESRQQFHTSSCGVGLPASFNARTLNPDDTQQARHFTAQSMTP